MTASVPLSFPDPETADNVRYNPSFEELRQLSAHLETTTEFDSPSYRSRVTSRSADRTLNDIDDTITAADREQLRLATEAIETMDLVCVDRLVGRHPDHSYCCRLYVPADYTRIALSWAKLLDPAPDDREPDFRTLQLPSWEDILIRVFPDQGLTFVLGTDYTGEAKKSFLRLFMYEVKATGGLGLHAGTKRISVRTDTGSLVDRSQLFLGLSATGKTTLTGHGCWLDGPETARMLQDDVCGLLSDGTVIGSEGHGLYIKTDGLDPTEQPAMYQAATSPNAVLENVAVDDDGTVDFDDDGYTANGRATVIRDDLPSADPTIDADHADQIFFITRHPIMPPVARLTPEQGAAAFMLGESIETSAGDPERAGEPVRVVGTNPFIIGPPAAEGNRFLELVKEADIECYALNTGAVGRGETAVDVGVRETVTILTEVARGGVEWRPHPDGGWSVPSAVSGVDLDRYDPAICWPAYPDELEAVRAERRDYLAAFDGLDLSIIDAEY